MPTEEKQLLLKDLFARAIYRPFVQLKYGAYNKPEIRRLTGVDYPDRVYVNADSDCYYIDNIKPYLRSMSSMTEEEKIEYCDLQDRFLHSSQYPVTDAFEMFDWLNSHHIDYRGLIPIGLALEAPEGMYKI